MSTFKTGIAAVALAFSALAQAVSDNKAVEQEVLASFHSLVEASKNLDAQDYFSHFDTEKFVGLKSDGTNFNSIDDLSPLITHGFAAVKSITHLEFPNVKVSVIDHRTAILVNEFVQTMELQNGSVVNSAGGGTQVWSKHNGTWKLVSVSASDKPLPGPQ